MEPNSVDRFPARSRGASAPSSQDVWIPALDALGAHLRTSRSPHLPHLAAASHPSHIVSLRAGGVRIIRG